MKCKYCNGKIYNYSKYCDYCGARLDNENSEIEEDGQSFKKEILYDNQNSAFDANPIISNYTYHGEHEKRIAGLKARTFRATAVVVASVLIASFFMIVLPTLFYKKSPEEKILIQNIEFNSSPFDSGGQFVVHVNAQVCNNNDFEIRNLDLEIRLIVSFKSDGRYSYYSLEVFIDEIEANGVRSVSEVTLLGDEPIECRIKIVSMDY